MPVLAFFLKPKNFMPVLAFTVLAFTDFYVNAFCHSNLL